MSGYLQRILRAASQSTQTIRPIQGSLFAPADTTLPAAAVSEFDDARDEAAEPSPRRPFDADVQAFSPTRRMTGDQPDMNQVVDATTPRATPAATRIPPAQRDAHDTFGAALEPVKASAAPIATAGRMRPPHPAAATAATDAGDPSPPAPAARADDAYTPLLDGVFAYPASSAAEQQPVAGAPADLVHAARALQAPASFAPLAQSAAREADEVRIHIGRIEVTAVAPAPARPAAPMPRHKAPSLEDYLKRRNGECS